MGELEYKDWTQIELEKVYKRKQIEKQEVLEPCKKLCRKLKKHGKIIKWRRLDALDMYHEDGEPDLEIWIPVGRILHLLFAECKKPSGGIVSNKQNDYRDKYNPYINVKYVIITNVEQLKEIINGY